MSAYPQWPLNDPPVSGIFLPLCAAIYAVCQGWRLIMNRFVNGWISSMRGVVGINWNQAQIRKSLVMIAMALALAGCANGRQDRVIGGALIGGAAGGAIIADATRPGWCYYWRHHRRHYVRC